MKRSTIRGALALGTALDLCLAAASFAQQAPTPPTHASNKASGAGITDVIVTARRVQERLQDVPISISVFNQKQVANNNIVNATDLAKITPSLSTNAEFGSANASFAIRGFVQDIGTPPSVGTYFADVVAPRGPTQGTVAGEGAGPGSFFDLQNVQVLKGPQGTLFGRNTTGGAILLVPVKPVSKFTGYLEESVGNYGLNRTQGVINVPVNDKIRFRLGLDHESRDGYLHNTTNVGPSEFGDINYTAVRASLVADITPDIENYTIFSYTHSDTNGELQKLIACNTDPSPVNLLGHLACAQLAANKKAGNTGFWDVQNSFPDPESRLVQWQAINTTTWRPTDTLTIKNIISFSELHDLDRSGLFGTNFQNPFGPGPLPFTDVNPPNSTLSADESTLTEEVQAQGSLMDERLTYQSGVYYEINQPLSPVGSDSANFAVCTDLDNLQCHNTSPYLPASVNQTLGQTHYRDIGVYSQATFKLTDQLSFTGGFRYTWDDTSDTSTRITYLFPAPNMPVGFCTDATQVAQGCSEKLQESSRAPTGVFDIDYKPTNDILLYAKYARGYRSGGVAPNSPSTYRSFQPEQVDDYEVGMKATFRGAVPGTFDINGFYDNFVNQQLAVGFLPAPGAAVSQTSGIVNAGQSLIYGLEMSGSLQPFTGLNLNADYTYLNAEITRIAQLTSTDPNYVLGYSIVAGKQLTLSPRNKLVLSGTYTLPLNPDIGRVSVGATFTYTSSQLTTYAYYAPLEPYFGSNVGLVGASQLLNLNADWNGIYGTPLDLSFFATNVTNRKYFAYVPGLGGAGFEFAVLGEPCFYGVRLRYRF